MALSTAVQWEVRTGGSDTNGGGFKAGASGTDWSQQNSAQYSVTDGVTAGTTTITSATANFGTDVVGNLIYVAGGTGSVTGNWYEITARTNSTTITVDRSTGLTAGTGVTLNIGGALLTISQALAKWVQSNVIWVKSGSYVITSGLTISSGINDLPNATPNVICGYTTTRGDNGQATITTATNSLTLLSVALNNCVISGFILDCAGTTSSTALKVTSGTSERGMSIVNCHALNFTAKGFWIAGGGAGHGPLFQKCYASGGVSGASGAFYGDSGIPGTLIQCVTNSNACSGFVFTNTNPGAILIRCISCFNKTGGTYHGVNVGDALGIATINSCVLHDNSGSGIVATGAYQALSITNTILSLNGAYGINCSINQGVASLRNNWNGFWSNTSGNRNNITAGPNDVVATGNPFVGGVTIIDCDTAFQYFTLDATTGEGAALRAAGYPPSLDIGAAQHQDSGGSSSVVVVARRSNTIQKM